MTTFRPQLVHETEVQRQHVRVELPAARVMLNGNTYKVQNISVGGVQLQGVSAPLQKHEKAVLGLSLPFEAFTLNLNLPYVIEHYDAKAKTLGCAFTALTDAQMSLLNVVIKSRMAGTIIDAGDILHIAGRSNLVKFKRDAEPTPLTSRQKLKRGSIFAAFLLLGLTCTALIAGNLYERLNVIKTSQAYVYADTIIVKAPVNGEFQFMLGDSITKLRTGQRIGQIKTYLPESANGDDLIQSSVPVLSPCDCFIVDSTIENGEFRLTGEPIMVLLPTENAPSVTAKIPLNRAAQVTKGQSAEITIEGERISGTVQTVEMPEAGNTHASVTIKTETPLPLSSLKKPAKVRLSLD